MLAGYEIVYLSPHLDDVCFSLGDLAQTIGHGTLVNLFTRGDYIAARGFGEATPDRVSAIRLAEDAAFADACGLRSIALDLEEPSLRGRRPHGAGLADDLAQLERPLLETLEELAGDGDRPRALFCPAAIGSHVNHLATLLTVARHRDWIEGRYRLFFYEDLFYSSNLAQRMAGLIRLKRLLGRGRRATRRVHPLEASGRRKLALVKLYGSQHKHPVTLARFSPATLLGTRPHEAFWEFWRTAGIGV